MLLLFLFLFSSLFFLFQNFFLEVFALSVNSSVTVVTLPPPTGLSATATSPYQIDLSWDFSSGTASFNIYRDNIFIASTSNVFYSDIGLSPAMTYIYNVSALDFGGIESGKSGPVSVTTLSLPSATTTEETKKGYFAIPPPQNPFILINNNLEYTRFPIVSLELFAKNAYQMTISNSSDFSGSSWEEYKPQKTWNLTHGDGEKKVFVKYQNFAGGISQAVFDSIILDTIPPLNVVDFRSKALDNQIDLKWQTPFEEDFQEVKILRSEIFYPVHPFEGVLVFRGKDNQFSDKGVKNGIRYYYTIFSFDKAGNFSSGAVVSEVPEFSLAPGIPPELPPEIPPQAPPQDIPPLIEGLVLDDFDFIQEGRKLQIINGKKIKVEPGKPLTISIDYEKFREVLKTIMVVIKKEEKTFSFILKIDGEKKNYFAVILPPEPRIYSFDIFVIDYKNQSLKKIPGEMTVRKAGIFNPEEIWEKAGRSKLQYPLLWLIIMLFFLTYIIRRRRKKKQQETLENRDLSGNKENGLDRLDNYFKKE